MTESLTIHYTPDPHPSTKWPDPHQDRFSKTLLGFWTYLMTDCILFASLFVTYAVLKDRTFGGPTSQELFALSTAFAETMILLASSVTCGFAMIAAVKKRQSRVVTWLIITFALGAAFLAIEGAEFTHFVREGHSWKESAFLSAFFALVGMHGLHIATGLGWMAVMIAQVKILGLTADTFRRLVVFSLFWHFLDLIWIFIFTFVYLMGVL